MIVQEDIPYTKEEVKAMVKTIHYLREQLKQLGWHPASELPPVGKLGDSEVLVVITSDDESKKAFYNKPNDKWIEREGFDIIEIKRWCYPPKEE